RRELLLEQGFGHLGLLQVVDPGAPAAPIAVLEITDLGPGERAQELPRCFAHALRVREMARIVDGHALAHAPRRRRQAQPARELDPAPHAARWRWRALSLARVRRVLAEQAPVLLERGAAARRSHGYVVEIGAHRFDHGPPLAPRLVAEPGV